MKQVCKDCKHSLHVHPFKKEKGKFVMNCTKYYTKVFEFDVKDCFESFISWHCRG